MPGTLRPCFDDGEALVIAALCLGGEVGIARVGAVQLDEPGYGARLDRNRLLTGAPRIQLEVQRFGLADGVGEIVGALGEAARQETGIT